MVDLSIVFCKRLPFRVDSTCQEYWADHSAPTIEKMMLDDDAASIDKLERPESPGCREKSSR